MSRMPEHTRPRRVLPRPRAWAPARCPVGVWGPARNDLVERSVRSACAARNRLAQPPDVMALPSARVVMWSTSAKAAEGVATFFCDVLGAARVRRAGSRPGPPSVLLGDRGGGLLIDMVTPEGILGSARRLLVRGDAAAADHSTVMSVHVADAAWQGGPPMPAVPSSAVAQLQWGGWPLAWAARPARGCDFGVCGAGAPVECGPAAGAALVRAFAKEVAVGTGEDGEGMEAARGALLGAAGRGGVRVRSGDLYEAADGLAVRLLPDRSATLVLSVSGGDEGIEEAASALEDQAGCGISPLGRRGGRPGRGEMLQVEHSLLRGIDLRLQSDALEPSVCFPQSAKAALVESEGVLPELQSDQMLSGGAGADAGAVREAAHVATQPLSARSPDAAATGATVGDCWMEARAVAKRRLGLRDQGG